MSLRILFADDSVTAQNMGKKILTEAGYEVVAVSNGAAAVKKIAEQKPDIIILDVYMPGYSGLEVCEKVRSSIATIKTPVLLTVGKMEPYKPEDANRVRADGVIIKPFEASDLLAIIKKFEERIGQMPPPPLVQQAAAPVPIEEIKVEAPEVQHQPPPPPPIARSTVEVPDHMATASAFSEMLGTDASHMEYHAPPAPQAAPVPQPEAAAATAVSDYVLPTSWQPEAEPQAAIVQAPEAAAPVERVPESLPSPIQIPVYREPEPASYELVHTAAAPIPDVEIPREPALQETHAEATRNTVADSREPGLIPTFQDPPPGHSSEIADLPPSALPELSSIQESPVIAAPAVESMPVPVAAAGSSVNDADFEARVAAAMAAYSQPQEPQPEIAEAVETFPAPVSVQQPEEQPFSNPGAVSEAPVDFEYRPSVSSAAMENAVPEPVAIAPEPEVVSVPPAPGVMEPEPAHAADLGTNHHAVAARVEEEIPAAVVAITDAAASDGADHENIAQAVHRVMERMKGDLVQEIVRELKSKK